MADGQSSPSKTVIHINAVTREFDTWSSDDIVGSCPSCDAHAIVALTPRLKAIQPDDTSHVCLPSFGGCNLGFAVD